MRRLIFAGVIAWAAVWPVVAHADHLNCSRAWPGTPTEANQAWADCKARDAAEHIQIMREAQQRQAEDRARQAAERERQYQRGMEERRVRALEEAAQAQRDQARAAQDAARNAGSPVRCETYREFMGPLVTECSR